MRHPGGFSYSCGVVECETMDVLQPNKSHPNGLMMAHSACARMDVLIFSVLCVRSGLSPRCLQTPGPSVSKTLNRSVSQNRLIHSSTMPQCPAWWPADGDGSEGRATKSAVLVLREVEEEEDCDRGTMSPTTPTLRDAYTPCINATRRIPSVLHSLTVYFLNNRWSDWYWDTWGGHTQINPSFFCISWSLHRI